ncbi:MAG: 50S ribosomal protein L22 [Candidatus Omnitrophica bacterium]|nr:50S ribosomal protein L22 [Candidatus Omnitrophota bacterium]
MIARAVAKYVRMSPRKVRYVMEPLRLRTVAEALAILATTRRRASKPVAKAVASAFANARQRDPTLAEEQVVISRLFADGGPVWKRFRAAAFGRAAKIRKPTTHITVELDRQQSQPGSEARARATAAEPASRRVERTRQAKPSTKTPAQAVKPAGRTKRPINAMKKSEDA